MRRIVKDDLDRAMSTWEIPALPSEITGETGQDIAGLTPIIRKYLASGAADLSQRQIIIAEWLFKLVRRNIKRGRLFELDKALANGRADCLGYVQLFTALGEKFGLPLGIVEVLVDNAGRPVPHYVNLLKLADGSRRFIDAWYGSADIRHRRMAAVVDGVTRDFDYGELEHINNLEGLPPSIVEALVLYIRGNRQLARGEYNEAIAAYTRAIALYPNNSRAYYNRAVAYEKQDDRNRADADYAEALKDESRLIRVQANIGDLEPLIRLDDAGINEEHQEIYLWSKGYKTGTPAADEEISKVYNLPVAKVREIIDEVERRCFS
ncbi:MAG: tetratricopeptide repeat protein [Dehalococcoidales bacterium]|nr:tetratricopeptide repeat protein [Dehalococcoidales bacterium]